MRNPCFWFTYAVIAHYYLPWWCGPVGWILSAYNLGMSIVYFVFGLFKSILWPIIWPIIAWIYNHTLGFIFSAWWTYFGSVAKNIIVQLQIDLGLAPYVFAIGSALYTFFTVHAYNFYHWFFFKIIWLPQFWFAHVVLWETFIWVIFYLSKKTRELLVSSGHVQFFLKLGCCFW